MSTGPVIAGVGTGLAAISAAALAILQRAGMISDEEANQLIPASLDNPGPYLVAAGYRQRGWTHRTTLAPIRTDAEMHRRFRDRDIHGGQDLGAEVGTPVLAARTGIVLLAGPQRGYGKRVLLKHRNGVTTLYAHLDTIGVERGQAVRGGAPIGTVGRTSDAIGGTSRALGGFGNGMSSHLHFSVHRGLPTANMSSAVERLRGTEPSAWCGAQGTALLGAETARPY